MVVSPLINNHIKKKIKISFFYIKHLKSKKHHQKIQEKRVGGTPATLANLSKKQINRGLNKRPIKFKASTNAPTLSQLKAGLNHMKPPNANSFPAYNSGSFQQQPQQLMHQQFDSSFQQIPDQFSNQTTVKASPLQYNNQQFANNTTKRKPLGNDDSLDAKFRRMDTSIPFNAQTSFNDFMSVKAENTTDNWSSNSINTAPNMYQNLMNIPYNGPGFSQFSQPNDFSKKF